MGKCVCGQTEVEHGSPPTACRTAPCLCPQYQSADVLQNLRAQISAAKKERDKWYREYNRIEKLGAKMCTERDAARIDIARLEAKLAEALAQRGGDDG